MCNHQLALGQTIKKKDETLKAGDHDSLTCFSQHAEQSGTNDEKMYSVTINPMNAPDSTRYVRLQWEPSEEDDKNSHAAIFEVKCGKKSKRS